MIRGGESKIGNKRVNWKADGIEDWLGDSTFSLSCSALVCRQGGLTLLSRGNCASSRLSDGGGGEGGGGGAEGGGGGGGGSSHGH